MLFNGFTKDDFKAFQRVKHESAKFNKERKRVWEKMRSLKLILDAQLQNEDFTLEGKVSQYWINYTKRHVNGIWIAYTDIKPYYKVCQLNCGIYEKGFFAGIEINDTAKTHLQNVSSFVKNTGKEFLSVIKKLNAKYLRLDYGNWQANSAVSTLDLTELANSIESDNDWFSLGEWYPRSVSFLSSSQFVSRIPRIFDALFPLYLVFAGRRPLGATKTDTLLRISDVAGKNLAKAEKTIAPEINNLDDNELQQLIESINERNRQETTNMHRSETNSYRRNPALSSALKRIFRDKCQICNTHMNVSRGYFCDTHHIVPLRSGGNDISDNILVLCPNHHRFFDRSKTEIISQDTSSITMKVNDKTQTVSRLKLSPLQ